MGFFSNLWRKAVTAVKGTGSAFVRVAEHDASITEARGKIIALEAANKAAEAAISELESAASKVHGVQDSIKSRLAALHASL